MTHDQEEALDVADRIVVMNNGKIEQIGSPDEVYTNPKSPFVYDFWAMLIYLKVAYIMVSSCR